MRYIKLFEAHKNIIKVEPDIEYEALEHVRTKLQEIYHVLGIPMTLGILTKNIAVGSKSILNKYYQFKFETNLNSIPYSIVSILTKPQLIPFVGASLDKPFNYKDKVLLCLQDSNKNKTFIQEISTSLSKYDLNDHIKLPPLREAQTFKGYHQYFNNSNPNEVYKIVNNFLLMIFNDLKNSLSNNVYTTPMGCCEITSLAFVIKEFILANRELNEPLLIPDTVIQPLKKALGQLPKSHEAYSLINQHNPKLYSALKSNETEDAITMTGMGFDD